VIGLLPESGYVQRQVVLSPGDLLVAFTEGVSEAINGADKEWGEERLIDAIRPSSRRVCRHAHRLHHGIG